MAPQVSDEEWTEFKEKFKKAYANDDEDKMRRERFAICKLKVETHNQKFEKGEATFTMGINHLSDLTEDEFALRCGRQVHPK